MFQAANYFISHLFRYTVPVSISFAIFKKASSEVGFAATFVHTEAVNPYGESFISLIASSSESTLSRKVEKFKSRNSILYYLLNPDDGTKCFLL